MVKITKHNYEQYIIDYLEDNLSQSLETEFSDFLSQNLNIKAEITKFCSVSLSPSETHFDNKFLLKKSSFSEHFQGNYFEELCIADIENDITNVQKNDLQKILIQYPEKLSEYQDLKKTICKSDKTIVFSDKEQLKRKTFFIGGTINKKHVIYTISAIAASLILFFSIINYQKFNTKINALSSAESVYTPLNKRQIIHKKIKKDNIYQQINNNVAVVSESVEKNTDTLEKRIYNKENFKSLDNISYKVQIQPAAIDIKKSINYIEYVVPEENSILAGVKRIFTKRKEKISNEINQINTLTIAQVAVNKYNNLTENNISIDGEYDEGGNLSAIALNTRNFSYYTNRFNRKK